jgi:hypothetical protein
MKKLTKPLRFCFISNSGNSGLSKYFNFSNNDTKKEFSFKNLNLLELKGYEPNIIIIDKYFIKKNFNSIINSIILNFKRPKIYFLSPEFQSNNGVKQSLKNKNHFFSNFNEEFIFLINSINKNNLQC